MGISENNRKWLDGIKIHKPTLHELMERQLRAMNNQQQFMEDYGLSFIEFQKLLKCGCQLVTLEHDKVTLVDPNHKPIPNVKQYLMHIDLGYEPVIDPRTIIDDNATDELIKETVSTKQETVIDDGNGNPLFKVIDSERGNVPMEVVIKQWLDGIGQNVPVGDDEYIPDENETHDLSIMDFVDINDYGELGFVECAKRIRELVENNYVVIIQSEFGFGNLDVPFTMLIRNSGGVVDVIWLDADWQYYNTTEFHGEKWKPCYDSYIENTERKLSLDTHEKRVTNMVDAIICNVAAYIRNLDVNNENDIREKLPELDFFKYIIMWGDGLQSWSCGIDEFETKLCEHLKSEYMLTPEQYCVDHPDENYDDVKKWDWEWDDPDEYYCCSYYVIYKHSLMNEILKKM